MCRIISEKSTLPLNLLKENQLRVHQLWCCQWYTSSAVFADDVQSTFRAGMVLWSTILYNAECSVLIALPPFDWLRWSRCIFLTWERLPARWHVLRCAVITLVICAQSAPSVQIRSLYFCSLAKSDATHFWNWCPLTLHEGYRERQWERVFLVFFGIPYVWYNGASLQKPCVFEGCLLNSIRLSLHTHSDTYNMEENLYMLINTVNTIISTTHFILHSILHVTMSLF